MADINKTITSTFGFELKCPYETSDDRNQLFVIISLQIGTVAFPGANSAQGPSQRANGPQRVITSSCAKIVVIVIACVKESLL